MKFSLQPFALIGFSFFLFSCTITWGDDPKEDEDCKKTCDNGVNYYNSFSVETISLEELQAQIRVETARPYEETGKLYFYNNTLFVNESDSGVHVLDVTDPSAIEKSKFLQLPGNIDIAIQDNTMYADLYSAMVQLDISGLDNNQVIVNEVKTAVFDYDPYLIAWELIEAYEVDNDYYSRLEYEELNNIKGLGETVFISGLTYNGVKCDCNYILYNDIAFAESSMDTSVANPKTAAVGQGGSLARFTVIDNYLYGLTQQAIKIFRINESGSLSNWSSVGVTWGIETLYRLDDYLFIGSTSGMFIYDITDSGNPRFISEYEHFNACDPVVAEGDFAYVTLRSTNEWCANNVNQLQIVDISNVFEPTQVGVYNMFAPYGLAVRGDRVWVCDSSSGIKIMDVSDKNKPRVVQFIEDYDARDIILRGNTAYVVTTTGIVVYDITNFDEPIEIGVQQL
ncbi:MAG: LVIVD repeat-containing protein [Flavobacteriaceae bacterium]